MLSRFLLAAALLGASATAQALALKIATLAPDGSAWMNAMRQGAEQVERRTDGRVQFRFYPGGVMGADKSVLRKIRVGQLHGGTFSASGLAQIYPDAIVYGLPFVFRSYEEVDYVRQRMDDNILKGLQKKGFVAFGLTDGGFAYLLSQSPIRGPDDLQGHKVWVPLDDRISAAGLQAFKVSPVPLPLTDVLTGLQTGLIDTVGNSPVGAIALQWHTQVAYLTDVPLFYLHGALLLQQRTFQTLTRQDQAVVREVMTDVFAKLNRESRRSNAEALRALQSQGIEIVQPAGQQSQWQAQVAQAMQNLASQGVFSDSALQTLRKHLSAYRRGQ